MAKEKKNVLTTHNKKPEDIATKSAQRKLKENNPKMSKDNLSEAQPTLSLFKSPLSDSSSTLIQEGDESDKCHADTSKMRKDRPIEINSEIHQLKKEQNSGGASQVPGPRKPSTEQLLERDSVSHRNPGSTADKKVPVSKTQTGHKVRGKKKENKTMQNRKVTDYYPIRRSSRKTKAELKNEEHKHLDDLIKNGIEEGMEIKHIEGKGRGVFAVSGFKKGDFVVEYHGDLLDLAEAKDREAQYAQDPKTGCYMYYFQYHCKTLCVDATKETNRLGRLINHSKNGNCQTKLHDIDGKPHLILVASRDIEAEEELLYDYGDRSKASISAHPWLKH
ncbi:lysine methyltransferase 5Ab [Lampris incognitus]|uniref:lysine methyltransferase 5Ab n=1 Tax=Lampris incognitus TaxID=2546036 RepID=UPI0024B62C59|nr:lysine methyltransferase 5Ab [Lampris incognitus]